MDKKPTKKVLMSFRISSERKSKLDQMAKDLRRSQTSLIEQGIDLISDSEPETHEQLKEKVIRKKNRELAEKMKAQVIRGLRKKT